MTETTLFRTECNGRSKYFADIAEAFKHFYKCVAERKDVELWRVAGIYGGAKRLSASQELLDFAYFN